MLKNVLLVCRSKARVRFSRMVRALHSLSANGTRNKRCARYLADARLHPLVVSDLILFFNPMLRIVLIVRPPITITSALLQD